MRREQNPSGRSRSQQERRSDQGLGLVEAMIAVAIALIAAFSMGTVIFIASATGKNQGTEATRATIYAQDKMEKLLSLDFNTSGTDASSCVQSASSQPASCNTTGITGSSWTQGLLAGGTISPMALCGSALPGYEDFLDASGIQLTGSGCSAFTEPPAYIRQWQITDLTQPSGGPPMKQITVAVYSLNAENALGGKPVVVLTSVLSDPN